MIENDAQLSVELHPFPHLVADGLFDETLLAAVVAEFPDRNAYGWKSFANSTERKLEGSHPAMWGEQTVELLREMASQAPGLAEAFGTPPLTMETIGGGYHLIEPGGYLAMHADFSRSPSTGRFRWLNMLVYLNASWEPENGGELQLWDDDGPAVTIAPEFNRTVVFRTSGSSWHGHPKPVAGRPRRSVAAYFYAEEPPPGYLGDHSTRWHPKVAIA
jgi:2-oxoglutarate-Fe(II)-dependent oxygenase superfamily protein